MNLEHFEKVVKRCEALAARSPGAYRLRVALLATLGFVVMLALLIGAFGSAAAIAGFALWSHQIILVKFAFIPIVIGLFILKSMWLRIPPPAGIVVTRKSAPALFAELDSVHRQLKTLKVHRVVIDPGAFNAAVVQIPRLGPLGWSRNHLIIGLPLLEALTAEEFRAVLGHELGHLSRKQSRFRNWIYRTRQMWERVALAAAHGTGLFSGIVNRFFAWYSPYFNAYSFAMARANEFDADKAAAEVAGRETTGRALTAVNVKGYFLNRKFMAEIWRRSATDPKPPADAFHQFLAASRSMAPAAIEEGLSRALADRTSLVDTHPSLTDRLAALGAAAEPPQPLERSAAEVLLADMRAQLIETANSKWLDGFEEHWEEAHESGKVRRTRLAELSANALSLDAKGLLEFSNLVREEGETGAALQLLDHALAQQPDYAPALFMRGRLKLGEGDATGVVDIEQAIKLDPYSAAAGYEILMSYFADRRETKAAQHYRDQLKEVLKKHRLAEAERSSVLSVDDFLPHGLDVAVTQAFAAGASSEQIVRRAWLARKRLEHFPENPLYVLVVETLTGKPLKIAQLDAIVGGTPNVPRYVIDSSEKATLTEKVTAVEGSLIFSRT